MEGNTKLKQVGIGIIGLGYMGTHHFRVLRQLENQGGSPKVVGVCDVNHKRLENFRDKGLQVITTVPEDLLRRKDIDAVYIATPWNNHADLIRSTVAANKHLYCEKPIARSVEEIEELVSLVKDIGVQAQCGLLLRHQPSLWKIKSIIDSGELGNRLSLS